MRTHVCVCALQLLQCHTLVCARYNIIATVRQFQVHNIVSIG
jgi:hypothetical protein